MGTINFTVCRGGRTRGDGAPSIAGTTIRTSDAYTTSTSASFVEDGSGDITLSTGEVFQCHVDEDMWVRFGGSAATVGDGFFIPSGGQREFEVDRDSTGKVSAIDVA